MRNNSKYHLNMNECFAEWIDAVLPWLRILIPAIMLNILTFAVHSVYISEIQFEISSIAMRCITLGTHMIAMWYGMKTEISRGWLYEITLCFLATELVLFIYFMQYQFMVAVLLITLWVIGCIWMFTYGRRRLRNAYRRGYISQAIMDDIIVSRKEKRKPYTVFSVALRRYLITSSAVLLVVPSFMMVYNYGIDGTKQIATEHAVIDNAYENQLIANLSSIWLLEDTNWTQLNNQQKVDALQVIADIETNYMGIAPVIVVNCNLENRTIGAYDHSKRRVQIDLEKHTGYDPLEYVNTVLHECRHAYQHDCVESLDWNDSQVQNGVYFAQARTWRYEQNNYVSASENRDLYYNQLTEKDARYYAEEGSQVYQQYIYLSNLPPR